MILFGNTTLVEFVDLERSYCSNFSVLQCSGLCCFFVLLCFLSCQTQSVLQDMFFGRNVCVFIYLYIYIFIYLYIFLLQFFQISTRSVDHSFSAIVLKLDMYTRERNSVRRTNFRRSRSKVKVTRRSNIKINETLSF